MTSEGGKSSMYTNQFDENNILSSSIKPSPIHTSTQENVDWKYMQSFGDDGTSDDDLVTSMIFDSSGNYIIVGDKAGRVCIFEAFNEEACYRDYVSSAIDADPSIVYPYRMLPNSRRQFLGQEVRSDEEAETDVYKYRERVTPQRSLHRYPVGSRYSASELYNRLNPTSVLNGGKEADAVTPECNTQNINTLPLHLDYRFRYEYQAHDCEFDSLKSSDIEPRVTSICCGRQNTPMSTMLLSSSDKTIKLWRIRDKTVSSADSTSHIVNNMTEEEEDHSNLRDHSGHVVSSGPSASMTATYRNGHSYHIHSVAVCADDTSFVSCDEQSVNLWDQEHPEQAFQLLNLRPPSIEEVMEVATRVTAHPTHSELLALCTSRGCTRLLDRRMRSTCDVFARLFEPSEEPLQKTFFSEIVNCVSDAKFTDRYLVTRDFFNVNVWDLTMESRPVATIPINPVLRNHTCDLYENDCLFDQFKLDVSPDGEQFVTGTYHNQFVLHNIRTNVSTTLEAGTRLAQGTTTPQQNIGNMDFSRKALHTAWHPQLDVVAVAGVNKLYVYQGQ